MSARNEEMAHAALTYIDRGWPVFPVFAPAKKAGGCTCGDPDCSSPVKHPAVRRGLHAATTDRDQLLRWWRARPDLGVAIRTGSPGPVVLDVDPRHGGDLTLRRLEAEHGPLLPGPVVRTGGGGWHVYLDGGVMDVPTSAGKLGPGLDVRGRGGYVVSPPSVHASGARYRWESESLALPAAPAWVRHQEIEHRLPQPGAALRRGMPDPGREAAWAQAALAGELQRVALAPEGARNDTLNLAAFSLGQVVGGGLLDREEVATRLRAAGTGVGLSELEVERTVRSGLEAGTRLPRRPESATPVQRVDRSRGLAW